MELPKYLYRYIYESHASSLLGGKNLYENDFWYKYSIGELPKYEVFTSIDLAKENLNISPTTTYELVEIDTEILMEYFNETEGHCLNKINEDTYEVNVINGKAVEIKYDHTIYKEYCSCCGRTYEDYPVKWEVLAGYSIKWLKNEINEIEKTINNNHPANTKEIIELLKQRQSELQSNYDKLINMGYF